jgi:hypothetical protein
MGVDREKERETFPVPHAENGSKYSYVKTF